VAREGVQGEALVANQIYVAPGGFHMHLTGVPGATQIALDQGPQRNFVRPCADFLFESAAKIYGRRTLGIVFTGMGRDGADGAAAIKAASGGVLIQSEESCVVFGMPGAVHAEGHFDFVGNTTDLAVKTQAVARVRRAGHVA
jgi:two-component system chemotaxis response regulator CheB